MSVILVDRRTGSKDLADLLPKGYAELTDLEFGDAVVVGNGPDGPVTEAFERKRLADALACVQSGRFAAHQLIGLRESYDYVWLVIEDEIRADPRSGILQRRYEARTTRKRGRGTRTEGRWVDAMFGAKSTMMWRDFWHWLLSMRRVGQIDDFAFTRSAGETAELIWTVNTWRQKDWKQHKSTKVFNRAHDHGGLLFRPPLVAEVAGRYDGVGYEKALAIAQKFESVQSFTCATVKELMTVEGIGKKLAESIYEQTRKARNTPCRT